MILAILILNAATLVLLVGYGIAAAHWLREHPMPPLPEWPDDDDEAGEKLAVWRKELDEADL
jgi:hypothetical protein